MAAAAGGMPNEAVGRPVPYKFADLDKVLDQRLEFFDATGQRVECCFWAMLNNLKASAKGLQERLLGRLKHYEDAEVTENTQAEYKQFQEQFNELGAMVVLARNIFEQFQQMGNFLIETSRYGMEAKPINNIGNLKKVMKKIENTANSVDRDYLTEGTYYCYLPDRLTEFQGLATASKLQDSNTSL